MTRKVSLRAMVVVVALLVGGVLAVQAGRGIDGGAVYYYTPSEVAGTDRPEVVRVGGKVVTGSVRWDEAAGVLRFALTDGRTMLPVANRGAPPKLFRGGREALVEGRVTRGVLRSSDVIVKHDENYRARDGARATDGG